MEYLNYKNRLPHPRLHSTSRDVMVQILSHQVSIYIIVVTGILVGMSQHCTAEFDVPPPISSPGPDHDSIDACEACESLVKSFEKGLARTTRGKHEGGDTQWEEKNLKSYADSEIRLVEIQEELCNELDKGKSDCLKIVEESETDIEDWWREHRKKNVRLRDYLCINKLKKCCPENHFGATCQECPSACNKHGSCDGSGTRRGSGRCICQPGYAGDTCDGCVADFYRMRTGDGDEFMCLPCHRACQGGCDGPTSANCTACRAGYSRDVETRLCIDINECELSPDGMPAESAQRICPDGTYCVNTDGHYKCADCHKSCSTCLAYGPEKCVTCAPEHEMNHRHVCIHFSELAYSETDNPNYLLRGIRIYASYAPLLFTVFTTVVIILPKIFESWRRGQPLREILCLREMLVVFCCIGMMLIHPDFSHANAEDR